MTNFKFKVGDPVTTDLNSIGVITEIIEMAHPPKNGQNPSDGYLVQTKYGVFKFYEEQLKPREVDNREILHG